VRARVSIAIALLSVLAACGHFVEIQFLVLATVPSPDGSRVAYLYRLQPPGGVFSEFTFEVSIQDADSTGKPWEGGEVVWTSHEWPLYVLWESDRSLEVLLSPGSRGHDPVWIRTPSREYVVSTRQLETTLKSEIAGSQAQVAN